MVSPIGGVAAFDLDEGIVSPGGVGYDINCGCRLMTTLLRADEIRPLMKDLVTALFKNIPSGVGSTGAIYLSKSDETKVAVQGAAWAVKKGLGTTEDLERTEDHGVMEGADPSVLSDRVIKRDKRGHDSKFWLQLPRYRPVVESFQGSKNGKRPGHTPRVGG
jgi:tRNA-splicing ligase RtcB